MAKTIEFNHLVKGGVFQDYKIDNSNVRVICWDVVDEVLGYTPKRLTVKIYDKNPKKKHTFKVTLVDKRSAYFEYLNVRGLSFVSIRGYLVANVVSWITLIDESK